MSPAIVLDASAGIRLVLSPADHREWIEQLGQAAAIIAPTLFAAETANALWKYRKAGNIPAGEAAMLHAQALALITDWQADTTLFPEALHLAERVGHPVYDCLYLVCCRRYGARLVSADRQLLKLAGGVK